jgi:hypothetical protein
MNGALGSGKLDVLEEHALDGHDGREPLSSGWKLKCGRGASSVAAVCFLLTLGSFVVPKSGHGLGSMVSVSMYTKWDCNNGDSTPAKNCLHLSRRIVSAAPQDMSVSG